MSYIGEARSFRKTAKEIAKRLRTETLTNEERKKLETDLEWYDVEARAAWAEAGREARMEEQEEYDDDKPDDDEEEED